MPSSVPAIISSSDEPPGRRPTLVMRTIGSRAGPSARTMPPEASPTSGAESRRASERGFPTEDAIELDRVAHRLVDLQGDLVGVEDHGGGALRALRRLQQSHRLLGHRGGVGHEVEATNQLPALRAV